jgi:hypothetical protein
LRARDKIKPKTKTMNYTTEEEEERTGKNRKEQERTGKSNNTK